MPDALRIAHIESTACRMSIMYWKSIGQFTGIVYFSDGNYVARTDPTFDNLMKSLSVAADEINKLGVNQFFN